jgi:hypothetical protein
MDAGYLMTQGYRETGKSTELWALSSDKIFFESGKSFIFYPQTRKDKSYERF